MTSLKKLLPVIHLVLFIFGLQSCVIEKRHYRDGYYVKHKNRSAIIPTFHADTTVILADQQIQPVAESEMIRDSMEEMIFAIDSGYTSVAVSDLTPELKSESENAIYPAIKDQTVSDTTKSSSADSTADNSILKSPLALSILAMLIAGLIPTLYVFTGTSEGWIVVLSLVGIALGVLAISYAVRKRRSRRSTTDLQETKLKVDVVNTFAFVLGFIAAGFSAFVLFIMLDLLYGLF